MIGNSWSGFNALQVAALRPPALKRDRHLLLHGRPLRRRHALHGRPPADGHARLGDAVPGAPRPAARSGPRRRPLARDVAERASTRWTSSRSRTGCATSSVTGSGSTAPSTRTTRGSSAPVLAVGGWLDGYRTRSRGSSRPRRPASRAHRPMGACLPAPRDARAELDFLARGRPLVRPLAEGPSTRASWMSRCSGPGWPRTSPRRRSIDDGARPLGRRAGVAVAPHHDPAALGSIGDRLSTRGIAGRSRGCPRSGRRRHSRASSAASGARSGPAAKGPEFPGDQREDDGRSLTLDGAALDGAPRDPGRAGVELELAVDRPSAFVAVRLCDVRPDGASTRVSYRRPEPHPPRRPRGPRGRWCRASATASGSSSTTRRYAFGPAIGSGSRSRRLLADGLAVARAGAVDGPRRDAGPAGPTATGR